MCKNDDNEGKHLQSRLQKKEKLVFIKECNLEEVNNFDDISLLRDEHLTNMYETWKKLEDQLLDKTNMINMTKFNYAKGHNAIFELTSGESLHMSQ